MMLHHLVVIGSLLKAWLGEPLLLVSWGIVVAAVLGAGRVVGLPMLFWHERRREAFWAGLFATFLMAETFFVEFMLDMRASGGGPQRLNLHLGGGGVLWALVVAGGAWRLRPQGAGVVPRPRKLVGDGKSLGGHEDLGIRPWPFVAGVLAGGAAVVGWLLLDARLLGGVSPTFDIHHKAAAVTVLVALMFVVAGRRATPAVGLCMLLTLVAAAYGFVTFWWGMRGAFPLLALGIWFAAGLNKYRLRLPALATLYPRGNRKAVPYPPKDRARLPDPPLLLDRLITDHADPGPWPGAAGDTKRPLIFVCVSGGGIRAAAWTAGVLTALDEVQGFRQATRMITGASGGMVGVATWAAWHEAKHREVPQALQVTDKGLFCCVALDSLTATARRLFFNDIPRTFWPWGNRSDRGLALETAWRDNATSCLGANLALPLAELRVGEERGDWPSLVFTPMLVEDGRRLVISNLALERVVRSQARWLTSGQIPADEIPLSTSSVSAYHAASLFPEAWATFPLSTAARLSAAFPYVSGAVVLPTEPRRRIVDAGYYDDYGVDMTCGFLREALACQPDWIRRHVSRILILQIRDNVSNLSINPDSETEKSRRPESAAMTQPDGSAFSRGLEGISSPPEGLLSAMDSVALFRNDAQIDAVTGAYQGVAPVSTAVFEFKGEASLSWYLTKVEKTHMRAQLGSPAIKGKVTAIREWLEQPTRDRIPEQETA